MTTASTTPENSLLSAQSLLVRLWPDAASRPSLRWLRKRQLARTVPFVKIGKLVWFDPANVSAAIRKFELPCI